MRGQNEILDFNLCGFNAPWGDSFHSFSAKKKRNNLRLVSFSHITERTDQYVHKNWSEEKVWRSVYAGGWLKSSHKTFKVTSTFAFLLKATPSRQQLITIKTQWYAQFIFAVCLLSIIISAFHASTSSLLIHWILVFLFEM